MDQSDSGGRSAFVNRVRYQAFREWHEGHKHANNVAVAFELSLGYAELALQPGQHGWRAKALNLSPNQATHLLRAAPSDLAYLAVPQIVANYLELQVGTVHMCRRAGLSITSNDSRDPSLWNTANLASSLLLGDAQTPAERCMTFAIKLRNRVMHGVGRVNNDLISAWKALDPVHQERWKTLAGRAPGPLSDGAKLELGSGEVKAVLALAKEAAADLNERLGGLHPALPAPKIGKLTKAQWAIVVVTEYKDVAPRRAGVKPTVRETQRLLDDRGRSTDRRMRRLVGHAQTHFRPLELTVDDLSDALDQLE